MQYGRFDLPVAPSSRPACPGLPCDDIRLEYPKWENGKPENVSYQRPCWRNTFFLFFILCLIVHLPLDLCQKMSPKSHWNIFTENVLLFLPVKLCQMSDSSRILGCLVIPNYASDKKSKKEVFLNVCSHGFNTVMHKQRCLSVPASALNISSSFCFISPKCIKNELLKPLFFFYIITGNIRDSCFSPLEVIWSTLEKWFHLGIYNITFLCISACKTAV